jgi:hypothetical protein
MGLVAVPSVDTRKAGSIAGGLGEPPYMFGYHYGIGPSVALRIKADLGQCPS